MKPTMDKSGNMLNPMAQSIAERVADAKAAAVRA
jgi:hypothetical protein